MASSSPPLCVFITIIISIGVILTDYEAIPHMATNDDEYDGHYIPKGTILFGSAWPLERLMGLFVS